MQSTNLQDHTGAEIHGVDLRQPLTKDQAAQLRSLIVDRGVVVFRNQKLTPSDFVGVARALGEIEDYSSHAKEALMPGHPEIMLLTNISNETKPSVSKGAGQYWHTDRSYVAKPGWASMLYAREVPRDDNGVALGETHFANMIAAADALDPNDRRHLESFDAVHEYVYRFTKPDPGSRMNGVQQPMIIEHPISGQKALYVNAGFTHSIVGMSEEQSRTTLKRLFAHAKSKDFVYTHYWEPDDLVIWDNFSTQHCAVDNYTDDQRRMMWRTTLQGWPVNQRSKSGTSQSQVES